MCKKHGERMSELPVQFDFIPGFVRLITMISSILFLLFYIEIPLK